MHASEKKLDKQLKRPRHRIIVHSSKRLDPDPDSCSDPSFFGLDPDPVNLNPDPYIRPLGRRKYPFR